MERDQHGGGGHCRNPNGCGTVFELTPAAAGETSWTKTVLYAFAHGDGAGPRGGLIMDASGTLFGTTSFGGTGPNGGTVFQLQP